MTDDGPVAAGKRAPLADAKPTELPDAGVAGDELAQTPLEHASGCEVHLRPVLEDALADAHEREEDPGAGHPPAALHSHERLKGDDRLTVATPAYPGHVTDDRGFLARDGARKGSRADAAEHHAVGAHIGLLLIARAGAHGQHGDQHADSARHADDDRQHRAQALRDSREAHGQQGDELSQEVHALALVPVSVAAGVASDLPALRRL